jgi:predicted nucleic acid-binding protein
VAEADWIAVQNVTALDIVQLLQAELDEGETEAIALAHQVG